MIEQLKEGLLRFVEQFPPHAGVAILSAAPISEFRGGIPYGIAYGHLSPWEVLPIAIVSCVLPALPILLLFNWATTKLADKPLLGKFVQRILQHARHKSERVQRWGAFGLVLFAGVPLPGFGVYTGALVAAVLGVSFWRAMGLLALGVTLGSCLVAGLTVGGVHWFQAATP